MEVGGQCHAPAALPPGKTRYPLYMRLGAPRVGLDGLGKSRPPPTVIRSPDRPARSESLHRLSYPGPHIHEYNKLHYHSISDTKKPQPPIAGVPLNFRCSSKVCHYTSPSNARCATPRKMCWFRLRGGDLCLLWELHAIHKYTLWTNGQFFKV
jgi:hypothetical protein